MSAPEKDSKRPVEQGGDFLSRWSRRKVEAKEQEVIDQAADIEQPDLHEADEKQLTEEQIAELSDEEILEELGLPDPDTMQAGDDFKSFMEKTVPARIRNRALRKLWLSNPALANVDMLVDYGEDFTDAATVVPDMKTAYEVGKGIAKRFEEMAEKLKLEEELGGNQSKQEEFQEANHVDAENQENVQDSKTDLEQSDHEQAPLNSVDTLGENTEESVELRYQSEVSSVEAEIAETEPVYVPKRMRFTV
ncbi:MAG: DUF3306 domain-containing protein [Hyphomicrobiales bacterium]